MTSITTEKSQKERMLRTIIEAGSIKDWPELKSRLDFFIDPHSATHLLHSLKAEGLITLREKERTTANSESRVVDIQPTKGALQRTMNLQPVYWVLDKKTVDGILGREGVAPIDTAHTVRVIGAHSSRHPIGKDATDYRQHSTVAEGGPVIRVPWKREPEAPKPDLLREPNQNEKPYDAWVDITETNVSKMPDLSKFPLISQLISRGDKINQAAQLLEEAGLTEQAVIALESISYTAFEQEVLALVKELK